MQKKRKKLFTAAVVLIAYYIFVRYTGYGIPCMFYEIFHLKCPGCGITRMLLAVTECRWRDALRFNAYLFVTLPYLIWLSGRTLYYWLKDRDMKMGNIQKGILFLYLAGLILFGIGRNIL